MSVLEGFEEISEKVTGKITMTVMPESVRFSKATIATLEAPQYAKILVNHRTKKFAVQPCSAKDDFAIPFCKVPGKATSVTVRAVNVLTTIQKFFDFPEAPENKIAYFSMEGEYFPDDNAVVFDVAGAKSGFTGKRGPRKGTHRKATDAD